MLQPGEVKGTCSCRLKSKESLCRLGSCSVNAMLATVLTCDERKAVSEVFRRMTRSSRILCMSKPVIGSSAGSNQHG